MFQMKAVLLLALLPLVVANQCSRFQYWSSDLRACISCTKCDKNQILIVPCSTHRDTECKTISHAGLDLSWLDKEKDNDIFELSDDYATPQELEKATKNRHLLKLSSSNEGDDDIYQDFLHSKHEPGRKKGKTHKKHKKHHYKFNQRANDKFLKWDELPTTKKPHRNRLVFDPFKNLEKTHRHFSFPGTLDDLTSDNTKYDKSEKRGKALHDKPESKRKTKKFYSEDDEEKLEEWLILSEKELAQRKEDLLKNIKKDEYETEESNQKVKLNYPLYNTESELLESVAQNSLQESTKEKQKSIINDDIFKELVKDNAESKLEIETLMSNKKDSQYRAETANRHMFMGEPSTISEIIGQVKDPQEVIKEKVGGNFIIEKSKLSVVPMMEDSSVVAAVPFTAVERFVWDWQAVALISAVTACLLFFMVVTAYSLLNNSQLKRSKASCYTADMEEMSTRIALMQPTLEPASEGITLKKYPTNPTPTHKS
uniref:Foldase protein prsA n=2 Tax=Lygus hesperus TaxID=30085 RepID=A0A0A9X5N2_LYGHE